MTLEDCTLSPRRLAYFATKVVPNGMLGFYTRKVARKDFTGKRKLVSDTNKEFLILLTLEIEPNGSKIIE